MNAVFHHKNSSPKGLVLRISFNHFSFLLNKLVNEWEKIVVFCTFGFVEFCIHQQHFTTSTAMFNLILFGPPGSGKGTQSEKLMARYSLKHLSTGDLLRSEIARQTPLGMEAKAIMDRGELVPDEVVIGMIQSCMDQDPNVPGFLFDGFPRTAAQAVVLDHLLQQKNAPIGVMLALQVGEEELVSRLMKRGETSGRSDDTNEQVIRARIAEYHKKTTAVADHYRQFNKVVDIAGEGSIDEIFDRLCSEIDSRK
jgi:adenylate kinase